MRCAMGGKTEKWEPFRLDFVLIPAGILPFTRIAQFIIAGWRAEIKPGSEKSEHSGCGRKFF